MPELKMKCPVTNHAISTGVRVASDSDFNSLLNVAYHSDCPLCGGNHVWFKHDAWIADEPVSDARDSAAQNGVSRKVRFASCDRGSARVTRFP
jgi:hypothetical protein